MERIITKLGICMIYIVVAILSTAGQPTTDAPQPTADCGQVRIIDFGTSTLDEPGVSSSGATASVVCEKGYETAKQTILCLDIGEWEKTSCIIKDCGTLESPPNGMVDLSQGTVFDSLARYTCDVGYILDGANKRRCLNTGSWGRLAPTCRLIDCGTLESPPNGMVDLSQGTLFDSLARYTCDVEYILDGATKRRCLNTGSWGKLAPTCRLIDCGILPAPADGTVDLRDGTLYNAVATFACNGGYRRVGDKTRQCTFKERWNHLTPVCVEEDLKIVTCPEITDTRGTVWAEVLARQIRFKDCIKEGFTGNITRKCKADGKWKLPKYKCYRQRIQNLEEEVATLDSNATEDDVVDALKEITNVTKQDANTAEEDKLTDGELDVLSASLAKVVSILTSSGAILNENITDDVIESANNLIDDVNLDSWKSLSETDSNGAENVLTAVESIGEAMCPALEASGQDKRTIIKTNIAFEVQKHSNRDVEFPNQEAIENADDWVKNTKSKIHLKSTTIQNTVPCSITTVLYRNMTDILPTTTTATAATSTSTRSETAVDDANRINAPILTLALTPAMTGKIYPPIRITFEHADKSLTNPSCKFWMFQSDSQGYWSGDGCTVSFTNENYTICECDHLTNYAVLMSPFVEADATSKTLRIVSIVGIGVSVSCLLTTFAVHFTLWRQLRSDRTTRLMNLCVALLMSYVIFLGGIDRTESSVACAIIAATLQYIYLVVFCIMLVEGIELTVFVVYVFKKSKSKTKLFLIIAWVIPAIIVGISLGVTKLEGYGGEHFCWLSIDNGLIWAFVAPALVIIFQAASQYAPRRRIAHHGSASKSGVSKAYRDNMLLLDYVIMPKINVICIVLVIRVMLTSIALKTKKAREKIKTSLRSLCVLVPLMGISWILGIFYAHGALYFIQYIFAVINGLQGFFIFLFHCLLNKQVKNACSIRAKRKSANSTVKNACSIRAKRKSANSTKSTSKEHRITKHHHENSKSYEKRGTKDSGTSQKNKILQQSFGRNTLKPGTPIGGSGNGSMRRAAAFSIKSRDRLIGDMSVSMSSRNRDEKDA